MERNKRKKRLPLKRWLLNVSDDVSRRWPTATIAVCNIGLIVSFAVMAGIYKELIEENADKYLDIVRFIMS